MGLPTAISTAARWVRSAFGQRAATAPNHRNRGNRSRRLAIEGLENRSLLAAGGLDTSFDGDGRLTSNTTNGGSTLSFLPIINSFPTTETSATTIVSRSDGKMWVAGIVLGTADTGWISLKRLNANGSPDNSFDNNGEVAYFFARSSHQLVVSDMKVLRDGKLLIAGTYFSRTGSQNVDIFFLRYNSNGSLDQTFGNQGLVRRSWAGNDVLSEISAKSDGKIVAVGTSDAKGQPDLVVARYNADGSPDKSFNKSGRIHVDVEGSQPNTGISLRHVSGGKILAVGSTGAFGKRDFGLVRLNSDGKLDKTFSGDGKLRKSMGGDDVVSDLTLDSSKRPIVLGFTLKSSGTTSTAVVAKFNTTGSLYQSFGVGGVFRATEVASDFVIPQDLLVLSNGTIAIVGLADVGGDIDFFVARLTSSGRLDTGFGSSGVTVTNFARPGSPFPNDVALGMNVTPDGRILVCGYSLEDTGGRQAWAIARYLA